jgi:hypothetical protein
MHHCLQTLRLAGTKILKISTPKSAIEHSSMLATVLITWVSKTRLIVTPVLLSIEDDHFPVFPNNLLRAFLGSCSRPITSKLFYRNHSCQPVGQKPSKFLVIWQVLRVLYYETNNFRVFISLVQPPIRRPPPIGFPYCVFSKFIATLPIWRLSPTTKPEHVIEFERTWIKNWHEARA